MNKKIFAASLIAFAALSAYSADFNLGISGNDKGITGFALSVGEYYQAPVEEVRVIRRELPSDELSVVYFLARKVHRNPEYIAKMRANGRSWWDITISLGLDPREVYVMPRGNAYGHYKHNKNYRFKDPEIIEIVNTRFLASYHNVSDDEIYQQRRGGRGYEDIDNDYRGKGKDKGHNDRGHGHGHGRD